MDFSFNVYEISFCRYVLVRVSIAVKRHCDHSNSYKGKHLTEGTAYSFSGVVHYHHVRENGTMQHGAGEELATC